MAQKVQTLLIDDLDGGEAESTVRFGLDGTEYEIDLSAEHAEALRKALGPYVNAARRTPGSAARRPTFASSSRSIERRHCCNYQRLAFPAQAFCGFAKA